MELKEAIEGRTSIRAFLPKTIEKETVEKILSLAAASPSALNLQPWEVVVVAGKEKERLSNVILKAYREKSVPCGPSAQKRMPPEYYRRQKEAYKSMVPFIEEAGMEFDSFINEGSCRFYDAPVAILMFLDDSHPERRMICHGSFLGYLTLAAHCLGLGTCPIGIINPYGNEIKEFLNIPEEKKLTLGIALGYPDSDSPVNKIRTGRDGLENIVKWVY